VEERRYEGEDGVLKGRLCRGTGFGKYRSWKGIKNRGLSMGKKKRGTVKRLQSNDREGGGGSSRGILV